jgi:hypothetical protein
LRKRTISFVMSVCTSVRLSAWYNSAPNRTNFHEILYFSICQNV